MSLRAVWLWVVMLLTGCQPLAEIRSDDVISAVGYASISEQQGTNDEEKRIRAMRASKLDAYRELTEQVYGLRISASADMVDQQLGTEVTDSRVDGIIRGAKVERSYPVGDSYVTEMTLDLKLMERLKGNVDVYHVPQNDVTLF
ncbi:LPP20 family lipoprotein [Thaumasiovibrio sp. DFM-14]|uniref:LPP20 family lipoprotein n=1 Tax=Thaumasiovibrio sp. DFM-14 TaxID=3384792 RepID=UPI0039A3B864